jgi:hypothetical protein
MMLRLKFEVFKLFDALQLAISKFRYPDLD